MTALRYGFDLDQRCLMDIGMNAQMVMSLVNTFIFHPFPLYILLRKSKTMSASIRRGYIAMHIAFITYEIILFFLVRIYILLPYSGLYCEGPLCRMGLPNSVILGIMSFSIVIVQPPFAFLILRMHQMFMPDDSQFKLSKRFQTAMGCVQIPLLLSNVIGFIVFSREPVHSDELMTEHELIFLEQRGHLFLFGSPGDPQYFRYELYLYYVTLVVNFSVLLFFIVHTMITLKKTLLIAKSAHTQQLMKKLFEVFYWQLQGSLLNHVIPLTSVMIFMLVDTSNFPDVVLAAIKLTLLLLFTLNSTQFCAIFILKNSANRQIVIDVFWSLLRFLTNSKVAPSVRSNLKRRPTRQMSISMTVIPHSPH